MGKEKRRKEGEGGMIHFLWPVAFDHSRALLSVVRQPITSVTSRWAPVLPLHIYRKSKKKITQELYKKKLQNLETRRREGRRERGTNRRICVPLSGCTKSR